MRRNRVTVNRAAPTRATRFTPTHVVTQIASPTTAPWQPLPRQHGTTDRVIRDTDAGSTCGVREAPPSHSSNGYSTALATEDSTMTHPDDHRGLESPFSDSLEELSLSPFNFNYDIIDEPTKAFDYECKDSGLYSLAPERPCEASELSYEFGQCHFSDFACVQISILHELYVQAVHVNFPSPIGLLSSRIQSCVFVS